MSTPDTIQPGQSFRDKVRAARAAAQHRSTQDFEIPGFDGTIWGTFKALDQYADMKALFKPYEHLADDERELMTAAEIVVRACVGLYGVDGGVRAEVDPPGMRLGVQFAEWVQEGSTGTPDGLPMTDVQALMAVIIPNQIQLTMLASKLEAFNEGTSAKTDEAQVGNSVAPG